MHDRIFKFIEEHKELETPFVVCDTTMLKNNYLESKHLFPFADIFYAVKANPGKPIISTLAELGSSFDCASLPEIELVLSCAESIDVEQRISFGNTIKKIKDIKAAYDLGVRLFAFDSQEELEKISEHAPGAKVFCRILTKGEGAEWPLSRKFGCAREMAIDLLIKAPELGLIPYGVSFHVGSQQKQIDQWDAALSDVSYVFNSLSHSGIELQMVNIGGGLPSQYRDPVSKLSTYAYEITSYLDFYFEDQLPRIIIEPGRSLVGNTGVIVSEVILSSKKSYNDFEPTWIFLDIGKFHGLAETIDESIKYDILTDKDGLYTEKVILAGPTCDSVDILYENTEYRLSPQLKCGDKVYILSAGAYTTAYSSVGFNGFPPLKDYYI